jgi:hypothetical protein
MLFTVAPVSDLTTIELHLASQELVGLDYGTNLAKGIFCHASLGRHGHNRLFP